MTKSRFFFDDLPAYQAEWIKTIGTMMQDGVICGVGDDLFVYGDASGMQVKVKSGRAFIKGQFFDSNVEEIVPLLSAAPDTAGYYRYDLLVIETDWSVSPNTMDFKIIEGTASASPTIPELTTSETIWQIPLARVTVAYGDTNVASSVVLDMRRWALGAYTFPLIIGNGMEEILAGPTPTGVDIPGRGKIFRCNMKANAPGSISIDIWKQINTSYPPTVAETIIATGSKPTLTEQQYSSYPVWSEITYPNAGALSWPGHEFDLPNNNANDDSYSIIPNVEANSTILQVNLTLWIAHTVSPFL